MRPRLEQRACPCGGGDGRLPSRPPSQPAQTPTSAAPASSSPLIDRQFEVSALSGGSVGRLCGSGGRVWSGDRSPSLVCVFSGRLCVLGLWILLGLETGLFVSRGLFVYVCPPGTSARFGNVPGAGAFGGFDSPAGLRLRLLLLLARDVQSAVPSLRSSVVYAPYRRRSECAVCCFRCLWVWGILVALIRLVGFLVGLRLRASPSGFAFGLRLRASPSGPPEATTRLMVEEIRGKIRRLGSKPALLRRLGPCVTKEELESLHQKIESITRIFVKMLLFSDFQEKMRQADRRRRLRATVMTNRHVRMTPRTPQITLSPPALVLFVLLELRLEIRARVVITHAGGASGAS